jgi:hypothetical protein
MHNKIGKNKMPPLTLWKGVGARSKDYYFMDRQASEMIRIGGTEIYVHKYLGPADAPDNIDPNASILSIQDLVNVEIRDRKYDPDVYSLKGHHVVSDSEFNLTQFGLFFSSDTKFITFHTNDMIKILGRRLMSGDVLEILHMRDYMALDGKVTNAFYLVEEGARSAEGYSPTWWPHLWRVKCGPLPDSQEFQSILTQALQDRGDGVGAQLNADGTVATIQDLNSRYAAELAVNDAVLAEAETNVPFRNFQSAHFYVLQTDLDKVPDVFNSDGIPPNGSKPVPSGMQFPDVHEQGDFFLRLDFLPPVLYRRDATKWTRVETNWRSPWLPAGRVLASFINNKQTITLQDGNTVDQRTNLRTAITSKLDPDIE